MTIALAADGGVSFLLLITIYYCFILSRRLRALRADRAEFRALVDKLTAASNDAARGIAGLKSAADEIGGELDAQLRDAQALRDDLAYMLERGGAVADVLEGALRARRDEPKPEAARPRVAEKPRATPERRDAPVAEAPPAPSARGSGFPSRAERELLRALGGAR